MRIKGENKSCNHDKLMFPIDIIIIIDVSLIFGQPFLATTKAMVDVDLGEMDVWSNDE